MSQHEAPAWILSLIALGSAHISALLHPFYNPGPSEIDPLKSLQDPESPKILHRSSTCHLGIFLTPTWALMGLATRPSPPYITVAGRSSQQCQLLPLPTQGDLPGRAALPLGIGPGTQAQKLQGLQVGRGIFNLGRKPARQEGKA